MDLRTLDTYFPEGTVLRVDDVSVNLDPQRLHKFLQVAKSKYPLIQILLAVSPMVFNMPKWEPKNQDKYERVFPAILNAKSDHRVYFEIEKIGIPDWLEGIVSEFDCTLATHGLIHVDHRLLSRDLQEMSIITSASLANTKIFVPPFNKYNSDTVSICKEQNIKLVRWEDGWTHLGFHSFQDNGNKYYVHLHDHPGEKLISLL
jgi:hypothetical protein